MRRSLALLVGIALVVLAAVGCTSAAPTPTRAATPTSRPTATPTRAATPTSQPTATPARAVRPTSQPTPTAPPTEKRARLLRVEQPSGKVVYWVPPGPRRIDPAVFGTPDDPKTTGEEQIQKAQGPVKELLQNLPILVGLPLKARVTNGDGTQYTQTNMPTPFGDKGLIVSGTLDVTYIDRQPADTPGDPMATPDEAKLKLEFTDPQGHEYEVRLRRVFMPPLPGYETQGGVMIDGFHHGTTGTGSPLMTLVYTYGAFWGIGDLYIDGQLADQAKVTHCMTTNTVRDQDYRLVFEEEVPLPPEKTIGGQVHHTHCIMLPVTLTPQGPKFEPVKTAFELPNGQKQPFIHVMFEQDEIAEVEGVSLPETAQDIRAKYEAFKGRVAERTIRVTGSEFKLDPGQIEGRPGETLHVVFENVGTIAHNFTIKAVGAATPTIQPGTTADLTITLPEEPGVYPIEYFCSVPGHKEAGMVGQIVVKP